jgi:hypothetical protein
MWFLSTRLFTLHDIFDYIKLGEELIEEPFRRQEQLYLYKHNARRTDRLGREDLSPVISTRIRRPSAASIGLR